MNNFSDSQTKDYYESFSDVYANVWSHQMHTGLYDGKTKSLEKACEDMNVYLAKKASIGKNKKVLTVGCGRGGTDRFLVKKYHATVVGLDISEKQLADAQARATKAKLTSQIIYIKGSMTDLPLPDATVDLVWVQESLFHCHDRYKAITEFFRVLKPGGKLVFEDTVLQDKRAEKEVMEIFGKRVRVNSLSTPEEYLKYFEKAGFKKLWVRDLTVELEKTYDEVLKYIRTNREKIRAKIDRSYWPALDNDFDRPKTGALVAQKKLGCVAMVLVKK